MLEAGVVQAADSIPGEQIPVGDHACHDAVLADASDDVIHLGMQHGLASAERDDGGAQLGQVVQTPAHHIQGNGLRVIVVLVAVRAGEIAAANRDDVSQNGMIPGESPL